MDDTREQRIQAQIDQAVQELEQAPRMVEHLQNALAVHKDLCDACLSRGYCGQHNKLAYRLREWDRIACWSRFHKMESEQDARRD
jgi:hypothetical protein